MNSLTLRAALPALETLNETKVIGARVVDAWEYHLDFEGDRTLILSLSPEHNSVYWAEGVDKSAQRSKMPRLGGAMRDRLVGSRLAGVRRAGLDRVISFFFAGRDRLGDPTRFQLVAELTGKGSNLLLLSGHEPFQGTLVERLRFDRSHKGTRHLTYGAAYQRPESNKVDAESASEDELARALDACMAAESLDARKAMAAAWEGVGPDTAWEIQRIAGEDASPSDLARGWSALLRDTQPGGSRFEPMVAAGSQGRSRVLVYRPGGGGHDLTACASVMEALQRSHALFKESRSKKPNHLLLQNIKRALKRSENALNAISKETRTADRDGETLRRMGELVLAHAHALPKGADSVELPDPESGEPLTIKLNPKLSPADNAALFFKKAKKAERAEVTVGGRSRDLRARLKTLQGLAVELEALGDREPGADLLERMHSLGVSLPQAQAARLKDERAAMPADLRPRSYSLGKGWEVLVGKNNKGNHLLTFEMAKPHDVWMHAAQCPGSHVVLRHPEKGAEPPRDVLLTAAGIAAYFSKARNSTKVPVTVTEKRHVRRPRKAPVGQALVGEHQTIMVAPINPEGKT